MRSLIIAENFCPQIDQVRTSAIEAGFGTWIPATKGAVGSSRYDGMGFWGLHSHMLKSLAITLGKPVYPNNMFFRVTNEDTEKAYVHSDRHSGDFTCVAYLSDHKNSESGTGFFRHRELGITEMPTLEEMTDSGLFDRLSKEMVEGDEKTWELTHFCKGSYNNAVIFRAPLFHSRFPKHGIGKTPEEGRLIWGCHFCLLDPSESI
jgi:hypothetical protein